MVERKWDEDGASAEWGPLLAAMPRTDERTDSYRVAFGPSVACFDGDNFTRAFGVMMPDGSRAWVEWGSLGPTSGRVRRPEGGYTHGMLIFYPDGIVFAQLAANPRPPVRSEAETLFRQLDACGALRELMRASLANAFALYQLMWNNDVIGPDGVRHVMGGRALGGMFAALRDMGENHLDFYLCRDSDAINQSYGVMPMMYEALQEAGFAIEQTGGPPLPARNSSKGS